MARLPRGSQYLFQTRGRVRRHHRRVSTQDDWLRRNPGRILQLPRAVRRTPRFLRNLPARNPVYKPVVKRLPGMVKGRNVTRIPRKALVIGPAPVISNEPRALAGRNRRPYNLNFQDPEIKPSREDPITVQTYGFDDHGPRWVPDQFDYLGDMYSKPTRDNRPRHFPNVFHDIRKTEFIGRKYYPQRSAYNPIYHAPVPMSDMIVDFPARGEVKYAWLPK